jgi:Ca2+/Na+ antiporter
MTRKGWLAVAVGAIVGTLLYNFLGVRPERAILSYLGGLLLGVGAFEFGAYNIRVVDRVMPRMTLVAAMFSFLITGVAFALLLAASSPRVVDGAAIAIGLVVGLTIWLTSTLISSWVRHESSEEPVNIALQDESFPKP